MLWSAKNNAFFPVEMIDGYKIAGWEVEDAIEATNDILPFYGDAPENKIRGVNNEGMPHWVDIPSATAEELQEQAVAKKSELKRVADSEISWRQDAVDAQIATVEEAAALSEWKKYRVLLMRVDTSVALDIEWPIQPEESAS
ncbi:TPA: tail fiber assembly protein [Yersinia enterocolitica]|nr:tail fiber assembly protein [Yersinia enterocolitica]